MTLDDILLRFAPYQPGTLAVVTPDAQYTYRDLAATVDAYEEVLAQAGRAPGDRVMTIAQPGLEAIATLCACARLGLIWVPVSPENPTARLRTIADAISPVAVVCDEASSAALQDFSRRDDAAPAVAAAVATAVAEGATLRWHDAPPVHARMPIRRKTIGVDPAYVVFTSGSTGRPKGVVMSHAGACVFLEALIVLSAIPMRTVVGSVAPIQFDLWLQDVAIALGSGGTVAFVARRALHQPRELVRQMKTFGVNQMNCVPSMWTPVLNHAERELQQLDTLSCVYYVGEPFAIGELRRLQQLLPRLRIINCFGPSETIGFTFTDVPNPLPAEARAVSIGRGYDAIEILLIDEGGRRIDEPHVPGEMYLRGPTLFYGYWNDAAATARALVPNPLAPETGERVLKTGDLAYRDESGAYWFIGRGDDQIKVAGNRVELGEVSAIIQQMPAVANAVVAAMTSPDGGGAHTFLVAFVVARDWHSLTGERVREFCLSRLPRYMVPRDIEIRTSLPTTDNGKVDVRLLKDEYMALYSQP
jgi:amino acid adenylation domain-containing protein